MMESCFSKAPKVKFIDTIPIGKEFDYLRPEGFITFTIDTKYNIPLIEINFDGWFEASVRF